MSRPTSFPVFVADLAGGGCGHQHANEQRARNCAANDLLRHPDGPAYVDILKVSRKGDRVIRERVGYVSRLDPVAAILEA